MNIACIIPAHNEATRILDVLQPVVESKLFSQIIVVDDRSNDRTGDVASINGVHVIHLLGLYGQPPTGKSHAVSRGLSYLNDSCSHVCLLDADLEGLVEGHLHLLTSPVYFGHADATISRRKSYGGLFYPNLDMFSGERVLPRKLVEDCHLENRTSFEMEVLINGALIDSGARIKVVPWPDVTNPTKLTKYGTWQGVKKDWRMFQEMRKVGGVQTLVRQRVMLGRQVV